MDNLKQAAVSTGDVAKAAVHVKDDTIDASEAASEAVEELGVAVKFIEFRLWYVKNMICINLISESECIVIW